MTARMFAADVHSDDRAACAHASPAAFKSLARAPEYTYTHFPHYDRNVNVANGLEGPFIINALVPGVCFCLQHLSTGQHMYSRKSLTRWRRSGDGH